MRRITRETGKCLEKLAHAIEYLTDERDARLLSGGSASEEAGVNDAIEALKLLNRRTYYECPQVEPLHERVFHRLLGLSS